MVQVLAVEVMLVLIVEVVWVNGASASAYLLYMLLVLLYLLGRMRLSADIVDMLKIPAFGEILVSADGADGTRPPLSSTHYGLQRWCCAGVD